LGFLARLWFAFALAHIVDEIIFNNWGSSWFEWLIFGLTMLAEIGCQTTKRTKGTTTKGKAEE